MDSQLASVLTSGSLDAQNGSRCAGGPEAVTGGCLDSEDKTSLGTVPGNLQPCPVTAAVTIITQDAPPVNGRKPEGGGNSKPASQETTKIGGLRRPITVTTGVPALRSQPIRIRIVVPPRCERPITNSAISQTKDFAHRHFSRPVLASSGAGRHRGEIRIHAVKHGAGLKEGARQKPEEPEEESFHETEAEGGNKMCREGDVLDLSEALIDKTLSWKMIKDETTEGEIEKSIPLILREMHLETYETFGEVGMEEQTEPLDLSLPKKREVLQRRCVGCLDDSGCETSLVMEVDEYEGDGDRDVVEEDDNDTETVEDSLLSPYFFSTSVFTSLPSIDCDTDDLLLIDDQGIPYTLSPDGVKVPQVDASTPEDPSSDRARSAGVEGTESSKLAEPSLSQSLDNALSDMAPETESPSLGADPTNAPDALTSLILNSDLSHASESSIKAVQEANAALSPPSGNSVPSQPIQILTNPSTNAPILLLSSSSSPQLSSAPLGLTLPLSVAQTSPGASTPMFLLLSSVPSFSGDSTSTPIAVLDPSTGQLSQITAASATVSLPSSCGQVGSLGSPLTSLSHPVIRLGAGDPPVVLSGGTNVNSGSVLAAPASTPAPQSDHNSTAPPLHAQTTSADPNPGTEAISAEGISNENEKPSTFAEASPHLLSANMTFAALPSSEAAAPSPASESRFDSCDLHSEHLPLDDHLYFSNMAAPPSPPIGPILPTDTLDPLDPLSPAASPNSLAARRVLYCQLCPRVFFYLSDLERHAITHSQKKPHVCQQCGKAFKRSSHLQRHKHIHTGQRNFVCPICAKRFREAGELQRHQRVHTGEKPYQCQLCHTRFAERNTLRRHTKRKHPYHQVAMEMLNERRDMGGGGGVVAGVQEEEESAEWYSSTVSNLENSESEMET
ncbi:protein sister of odd and bowel [Platichthys flesus]|uniref:protein sister of odd and bowel n=1 Tax=Platichthys flesus TaxID=8260 RepID=UPI002DBB34C0|nr:protein sister of odd and bowel [Platichthys flesus]